MLAFIIWALLGVVYIGLSVFVFFSSIAPWANFQVKDIAGYNKALGKLGIICGTILILLGLPLLCEQNSPFIALSILGTMADAIAFMAVYFLVIERKYRKR